MATSGQGARKRWFGLPPRVAAGFGAALLALLVAGAALAHAFATRSAHGGRMSRTTDVLRALHELEAAVVVSATSLDVYVVTGDAAQRARYGRSAAGATAALERLEDVVSDEDGQERRLARLGRLVRTIQAQQARLAALRERGDAPQADGARRSSAIPAALREIHDLVGEMADRENAILRAREAAWKAAVTRTYAVAIGTEVILAFLLAVAARAVRAEIRQREAQEAERTRMLEVQSRLMAIVGHDLRTPLSGVTWNAALLGRSKLAPGDAHLVRRISGCARRMERLIRDVLDYSRVHAGAGIPIQPAPADLREIAAAVVDEVHDAAHPVQISAEGDTTGRWDADRVEQILANLVLNAVKYGPAGQPVSVRLSGDGTVARIEVHDRGGHVPDRVRANVFEPFLPGEPSGKGSFGLGLFIVRTLAEAHGGALAVDAAPERGTTFTVTLPRVAASSPAPAGALAS